MKTNKIIGITTATIDYTLIALITLESAKKFTDIGEYFIFVPDIQPQDVERFRNTVQTHYPWVQIITPYDLPQHEQKAYLAKSRRNSKAEFAMLGKFVGIRHVMRLVPESQLVVFLDSDLFFVGDMRFASWTGRGFSVALSPQIMNPTRDENEHEIMIHGWINSGFMIFNLQGQRTAEIVGWLVDRISKRGVLAPFLGLSGDQTWVAAVPFLFPKETEIMDQLPMNVAYWNLQERPLSVGPQGDVLVQQKEKLIFFHFSGFQFHAPHQLSKHSPILTSSNPALVLLVQKYGEAYAQLRGLKEELKVFVGFPCSSTRMLKRVDEIKAVESVDLYKAMAPIGFFGKLGMDLDSALRILRSKLSFFRK